MTGDPRSMVGGRRPNRDWHLDDFDRAVGLEGVQRARAVLDAVPRYEAARYGSNGVAIQCEHRIVRGGVCVLCKSAAVLERTP